MVKCEQVSDLERERKRQELDTSWSLMAGKVLAYCLKGGERERGTGIVYDGRGGLAGKKEKSTATSVLGGVGLVLYCIDLSRSSFLPFPFRSTVSEWGGENTLGGGVKVKRFKLNLDIA